MYSRVTQLEIDTMRVDVEDAVRLFREEVLPGLQEQDGYEGVLVLATPEGKGIISSFWETEEAATAAADFATGTVERYMTMFKAAPGRESYEVAVYDMPSVSMA